ncbi:acyl--CoA ligase [Aspergillus brunneoviolaceus CBS 621.78]|uniref:Phenylacetyl-CoA ligase n=1 Tax=Aspergillus brunneoviolaceus CBS 621.78 TaxID=1450534 RepID=A0ACD1GHK7_9EURO|nr:phenylacetyl-CoA ligase [Aspergillus brunneoviolaceus CBS 621.78]RAH48732.1 phenylacetyl-CoA ligase [Aspergillus brunneoviolaceus CBS 621.78]
MVFFPPKWVGELPPIPDTVPLCDFMLDERYGRAPIDQSPAPYVCNVTGQGYSPAEIVQRVDYMARALSRELGWEPNTGAAEDKVIGIFSMNTIDTMPLSWAVHRLSGIVSPANAAYSASELAYQMRDSKATVLFTCLPLLATALEATAQVGIPRQRVFVLETPVEPGQSLPAAASEFETVSQLVAAGQTLPPVAPLKWQAGQGRRQPAFLCYSSGTSGLPKGVMISHYNMMANILQFKQYDESSGMRTKGKSEVTSCVLPMSHAYGLNYVAHYAAYRGDQTVVFARFQLESLLEATQRFRITILLLVPPIVLRIAKSQELCRRYDLSSVVGLFTGAAPLGEEIEAAVREQYPAMNIGQGYGITEATTVVGLTPIIDQWAGSVGCPMPGSQWKLLDPDGSEITSYDTPGEVIIAGPNVTMGYLNNPKATVESYRDGWYHTGDVGVMRLSPQGNEHLFIIDRIKELIKVKGLQVAPAELEAHLLAHPAVGDCAVIPVPDSEAGELPKAFVVKSAQTGPDDAATVQAIVAHVQETKARHKWLKGGVEFVDLIPKSPSGKILRRLLRDREKKSRQAKL